MELICKGHNTCDYRAHCPHSILHEIRNLGIDQTEDCSLLCNKHLHPSLPSVCYCDVAYTRKFKLDKLKNKNHEKFSEEN